MSASLFAAVLILAQLSTAEDADLDGRLKAAPSDVRSFVARRADCDHWTGEEPYDAERRAEIEAAIADLRCARIEQDEAVLRAHYRERPDILQLLDELAEAF
ncbi:MAG TPA: hypothetical protein VIO94_09270 [Phenylobacterium sp.]